MLSPSKNMTFEIKYNLGSDQHLQILFFKLFEIALVISFINELNFINIFSKMKQLLILMLHF